MPQVDSNTKSFYLYIQSPDRLHYEGEVEAISAVNEKGLFDILPLHENFISLVKERVVIHKKIKKETEELKIDTGVIKVQENKVYVLLGLENIR